MKEFIWLVIDAIVWFVAGYAYRKWQVDKWMDNADNHEDTY